MKFRKKLLSVLLAASMIFSFLPARTRAEAPEEIHISTAGEFAALARNCLLDAWSLGKAVILDADIETSVSIPSFSGHFNGNGHTVRGVLFDGRGSKAGLFRTIEAAGVVENLTVEGTAAPSGSASSVGLLAGENYGVILNCAVSGTVKGEESTGGLAGFNYGTITGCVSSAEVTGVKNTGGIAGSSSGRLERCENRGAINVTESKEGIIHPIQNTGGVVGSSTGEVISCVNHGQAGYPHVGYNAGGIAGIHSGVLRDCVNDGEIQGRRGVGGIAGCFLPETDFVYGQDPTEALNRTITELLDLLRALTRQISGAVDNGAQDFDRLQNNMDALRGGINGELDSLKEVFQDLNAAMDEISGAMKEITEISGEIGSIAGEMGAITGTLDSASSEISSAFDRVTDMANEAGTLHDTVNGALTQTGDDAKAALDVIRPEVQSINGDAGEAIRLVRTFSGQLNEKMDLLNADLENFRTAAGRIPESAGAGVQGIAGDTEKYAGQASEALNSFRDAVLSFSGGVTGLEELVRACAGILEGENGVLPGEGLIDRVQELEQKLEDNNVSALASSLNDMTRALNNLGEAIAGLSQALKQDFAGTGAAWEQASAALDRLNNTDLPALRKELDKLRENVLQPAEDITNGLSNIFSILLENAKNGTAPSQEDLDAMKAALAAIQKTLESLEAPDLSGIFAGINNAAADLAAFWTGLEKLAQAVSGSLKSGADDLERYAGQISAALSDLDAATGRFSKEAVNFEKFLSDSLNTLYGEDGTILGKDASERLSALREKLKGAAKPDLTGPLEDMANAGSALGESISQLSTALKDGYAGASGETRAAWEEASQAADVLIGDAGALRESVTNFTGDLSDLSEDINTRMDAIGAALDTWGGQIDGNGRKTQEAVDRLLDNIGNSLSSAGAHMSGAADHLGGTSGNLTAIGNSLGEAGKHLSSAGDYLDSLSDYRESIAAAVLDNMLNIVRQDISTSMDAIRETLSAMTEELKHSNAGIQDSTDAILRQLEEVRLAANGITVNPEYNVEDLSVDVDAANGLVEGSENRGAITGDANVGGIAGVITVQISKDPEEGWNWDADKTGLLAGITAVVRAAVRACRNAGPVTARNESAGGIVGRSDLGAVLECLNTGAVSVENGSWCGGIVGLSKRAVRNSCALCTLSGVDSVGGIAGEAVDLEGCRSMITVSAGGEKVGAIAGSADKSGTVSGNYTVAEGVGCIDGVDLDGRAQGLPYDQFAALPGLPEVFLHFSLTFTADGAEIAEIPFQYGARVDAGAFPEPPVKDGYYASWERFEPEALTRSQIIAAVYTPWESTISSGGSRPKVLAEGNFSARGSVVLTDVQLPDPPSGVVAESWNYEITDPQATIPEDALTVRVLCPEGEVFFRARAGDFWTRPSNAVRDGSYLVFQAPPGGQMVLLAPYPSPVPWLAAGGAAVFMVFLALLLLKKSGKNGPHPDENGPDSREENPEEHDPQTENEMSSII